MKDKFAGFYRPTDAEFAVLWDESVIVLDANVLLNLYTYSESTCREVLSLFESLADRLWLPYQVAAEYHKNRIGRIDKESKKCSEFSRKLNEIGNLLRTSTAHPHFDDELVARFEELLEDAQKAVKQGESQHHELLKTDPIRDELTRIFDGRLGEPTPSDKLDEIYKQGEIRFEKKVPPGFMDKKKPEPDRYGDLVLWMQLIEHSKQNDKSMIFVTDDLKEDWWTTVGSQRVGPRPELRNEFRHETDNDVYLYSTDQFVDVAKKRGTSLSDATLQEIEHASKERTRTAAEISNGIQVSGSTLQEHLDATRMPSRDPFKEIQELVDAMRNVGRDPVKEMQEHLDAMRNVGRL